MTNDLDKAEQSAKTVISKNTDLQFDNKLTALKVLGDIYILKKEPARAAEMYEQMYNLAKAQRLNNPAQYAYAAALLADIWRKESKLKQSELLYREAIDWGENYIGRRKIFMAKAFYGLALVYYQQGNFKSAYFQLQQALPIATILLGPDNALVTTIHSLSDYILFHQDIMTWLKKRTCRN
jgi:tetratricopeptide (TPR) repeat protein